MKTTELIQAIKAEEKTIRTYGVTSLYLYGSRARGDHQSTSDVDMFLEYDRTKNPENKFSLLDLIAVQHHLQDQLALDFHLTTRQSLHPKLKEKIEQQAIQVF